MSGSPLSTKATRYQLNSTALKIDYFKHGSEFYFGAISTFLTLESDMICSAWKLPQSTTVGIVKKETIYASTLSCLRSHMILFRFKIRSDQTFSLSVLIILRSIVHPMFN